MPLLTHPNATAGRRLNVICRIRSGAVRVALGNRLRRTSNVCPVNVGSQRFEANGARCRLLDLDRKPFPAATLSVRDLPEIGDCRVDLLSEFDSLILGQGFEVGVKGVHAQTIANALAKRKQMHATPQSFAITANASFEV
nr:hypothetical protein [Burkholderia cepacia]